MVIEFSVDSLSLYILIFQKLFGIAIVNREIGVGISFDLGS